MDSSEWSGRVGDVWAEEWRRTDRSFVDVDAALVDRAVERVLGISAPRIVDVGCGAGTTSLSLGARLPDAMITGVDLSPSLIEVARSRLRPGPKIEYQQGDASTWRGESDADLLVSRHGVMFFADPVATFAHLRSLLHSGGAFVFSCFRAAALNPWASGLDPLMPPSAADPCAPGPFAFADAEHVRSIFDGAGWHDAQSEALDIDYVAGSGDDPVADAIDYFQRIGPVARALRDLDGPAREKLQQGLADHVRRHQNGGTVTFPAAIWIWSATA